MCIAPEGLNINNDELNPSQKKMNKVMLYKSVPNSESFRNGINFANEGE